MKKILVANGPNLNLLGTREPEIYGSSSFKDLERLVKAHAKKLGCTVVFFQSNHEGEIIDRLQKDGPGADGIILNPGALAHTSYAIYDCLKAIRVPTVEVHVTNIHARSEPFRHTSVTAAGAAGLISGLGIEGYLYAMEFLLK